MGGPAGMAILCTAACAWTLGAPPPAVLRLRRLSSPGQRPWRSRMGARAGATLRRVRRRRQRVRSWQAAVIELCDGLAAELSAGRAPDAVFTAAAVVLEPAVATALLDRRAGEDVPELLTRLARTPGAEGLRLLAACWRIGVERGGALAAVIENLAETLRDEETHRQEIAARLAGPRATARLLAGLPLLGLGMAAALGAHPLGLLFGTPPGLACLVLGGGLDLLGLWWTRRIAAAAEEPG